MACKGDEGALFCNGQYVDTGNNLQACVDALRAALDIQVEGKAEAHSECAGGNGCRAEGRATAEVSSGCSVVWPGTPSRGYTAFLGGIGLVSPWPGCAAVADLCRFCTQSARFGGLG